MSTGAATKSLRLSTLYGVTVPLRSMPIHERPRERMLRLGCAALSDAELVAVLIGGGRVGASAVDVAHELLREHHGLAGLAGARAEELSAHPGVGEAKAARVLAGVALAGRLNTPDDRAVVASSADVAALVVPALAHERTEQLLVVMLDSGHRVRRVERVAHGAVDRTPLPVREVLALVLRHDGRAFALAHNHPGGSAEPSPADLDATASMRRAAEQVGLRMIDHLIVAGSRWTSITGTG